jgi:hypothetical protein
VLCRAAPCRAMRAVTAAQCRERREVQHLAAP